MFCTYITYHPLKGKFYIGKSTISRIFGKRQYRGGGSLLEKYFKKYPREEWIINILSVFETEYEAYRHEALLVNANLLLDDNCLNISLGGEGGATGNNRGFTGGKHTEETKRKISIASKRPMSEQTKKKLSESRKGIPSKLKGIPLSEETKKKLSVIAKNKVGKPHSEETKKKMSESRKGIGKGIPLSEIQKQKLRDYHRLKKEGLWPTLK